MGDYLGEGFWLKTTRSVGIGGGLSWETAWVKGLG